MAAGRTGKGADTMNYLRAGMRIPVELPVQLRWRGPTGKSRLAQGTTVCMSGNGLFITTPVRLRHETPITVTVALPVGYTRVPLEIECQARVVRQQQPVKPPGIGAIIDDYSFRTATRPA
ncbi:MAG: PilZ domain-containing protein [Acidobacteria bacterium]|nr:PilZ domain-containing protein [Acidobacteriota bacterium]